MSREKKALIIGRLQEAFSKCQIVILTDYRGLATAEMTKLRRRLQESGSEYKVVKNTLARFAAERAGKSGLVSSLKGPVALVLGYNDIITPSQTLVGFIGDSKVSLSIKGGWLGDSLITPEEVMSLATLPAREVLLAKALGQMKNPIVAFLSCLTAPMKGIIGVLQARIKQLEVG